MHLADSHPPSVVFSPCRAKIQPTNNDKVPCCRRRIPHFTLASFADRNERRDMNEIEQRVLDAIDIDAMVAFLCELVAIPSLDGQVAEVAVQQHVADWMARNGLAVDLWELDFAGLRQHPAFCWEVERERGLGVVGVLGQDHGGRSLILNGHTDVVPAGDVANWRYPPWRG